MECLDEPPEDFGDAATAPVTPNGSGDEGSAVICHGCRCNENSWRNRAGPIGDLHCTTCHGDGHRACAQCGACLPRGHRWDRLYCSSTCRVAAHAAREDAALERAVREAEDPEWAAKEAAKERAEEEGMERHFEVLFEAFDPGGHKRNAARRIAELKSKADRCAGCDEQFTDGATIYRCREGREPVLPYCDECAGLLGTRKWCEAEPCAHCSRLVCNDRATADPHRFIRPRVVGRRMTKSGYALTEVEPSAARTFCSESCRRAAADARRKAKRGERECRCESCGETFKGRADARYCSSACRQCAYRVRKALQTAS